ncbi:MAG: extracellular solute-binding protein [Proteobacteria bacterium]|nr:extracellular solute-binding protein [Pseudomonadota bacterium]
MRLLCQVNGCSIQKLGLLCLAVCLMYGSSAAVSYAQDGASSESQAQESQLKQGTDSEKAESSESFQLPQGLVWESNDSDPIFADPRAKKGGTYYDYLEAFPQSFRHVGPDSNSGFKWYLYDANALSLVGIHPDSGRYFPSLATHWAVADDYKTVYFKLDQRARWSDGKPVTTEDYVFTLEFMRSPHIVDPRRNTYYSEEIAEVKVHTKDVISVVSGKKHVKEVLVGRVNLSPVPKHFHKLDKNWVKKYNFKVSPTTGPYNVSKFKKGKFIEFALHKDWWAKDLKYYKYRYNFHYKHYKVIRDQEATWQHFINGELSAISLTNPVSWHEKAKGKVFDRGYVKKLWFYVDRPSGCQVIWLNKDQDHWQDKKVRHAFGHALNFEKVIQEVARGEYTRIQSFYDGFGDYSDGSIRVREYDREKVKTLMQSSGYVLGKDGVWQKDGKKMTVRILYGFQPHKDRLLVLQAEALKAGFDIQLDYRDTTTRYKMTQEKNYDVVWTVYGFSRLPPPQYWKFWHSENAKKETTNLTNTKDLLLDKLIDSYRETFDTKMKQELSRKILRYIHEDGAFVPGMLNPFIRTAYWRHIQFPKLPGTRLFGPSHFSEMESVWIDKAAEAELKAYQKEGKSFGPSVTIDTTYKVDLKENVSK